MTISHFIPSLDALAPQLPATAQNPVVRINVELADGSQVALEDLGRSLFDALLTGLREGKTAHLELDEALVSPERAAELLGVSRPTIYAWQDRGRLGRHAQGSRRMVPLADIRHQLESPARAAAFSTAAAADDSPLSPDEIAVLVEARTTALPE